MYIWSFKRKRGLDERLIKKSPHVRLWRYEAMRGGLLGDLRLSGQLGVYHSHAYSKYFHRASHQVIFFLA